MREIIEMLKKVLNGDKKITITLFIFIEWAYKLMDKIKKTVTYKDFKANLFDNKGELVTTHKAEMENNHFGNVKISCTSRKESKRLDNTKTIQNLLDNGYITKEQLENCSVYTITAASQAVSVDEI